MLSDETVSLDIESHRDPEDIKLILAAFVFKLSGVSLIGMVADSAGSMATEIGSFGAVV